MATEEDSRFDRLPKWAKELFYSKDMEIQRLKQELDATRDLLNVDAPDEASVVADPYSANRRYIKLPEETPIEFRYRPEKHPDWWSYFHVSLREDNRLSIHGSSGMVIRPRQSNGIDIYLEDR
ncbi:hypothetical protein PV336_16350 [Streptomyces sp. MI02-2A]|uniref:DUF7239 family protein n=1 Tax=Streptomyces sp. MI02-2A TaxID=3028688 RepID=UPI0029B58EE6|nr:hypothetical protein [Streptomyces sp. MI02-2A]MDX3260793.1 hypothetical protein [Streptomyces sp. MI02-2A]